MNVRYIFALICFWTLQFDALLAQPINDDCDQAINISNVNNYCSGVGEFTNIAATESNSNNPSCWPQFSTVNDVWFSFTAIATDVNISVVGNTGSGGTGGSLNNPQYVLYQGSCSSTFTQIQCSSDAAGANVVSSFAGPLVVGETYYIRVAARNNNVGTFQLCVNNFHAIPEPDGDCNTGVVLCDKSSFTVDFVSGAGQDDSEITNAGCSSINCPLGESSSTWYKWTCKDAGSLTFTLNPLDPNDDLDFMVYELPSGIENCDDKVELRCMASGETVGAPMASWEICIGPTGLSLAAADFNETCGCQAGDDNFVAAIDMEAGKSYALVINNFTDTGNGFSIEWGGTGTFLGPDADFIPDFDEICLSDAVTLTDNSVSVSGIEKWEWNFGIGASPGTIVGKGPHMVNYSTPGVKSIILKLTSEAGCIVTHIENITVLPNPDYTIETNADYCDPNISSGDIAVVIEEGTPPFLYDWNNSGFFTSDSVLIDQPAGNYTVLVRDSNGCEKEVDFLLIEGLGLDPVLQPVDPPTCNGDADASITIEVEIGVAPISYSFEGGPPGPVNSWNNLPAGNYNITVSDAAGCTGDFNINIEDFPVLEVDLDGINISCFGETDGNVLATPTGGAGGYSYQWNNTNSNNNEIFDLPAGTYIVTLTDVNGCVITENVVITEPPQLFLDLTDKEDILCNGDETGFIAIEGTGGTPGFEYSLDGDTIFQVSPVFEDLPAGTYTITVRDSRGCTETLDVQLEQPAPLFVEAGDDQTVELGFTANLNAFHSPPFRPVTWSWSHAETLDCPDCDDPTAQPFQTTTYVVTVEDETKCISQDSVTIHVIKNYPIYIPNAFSPNNDGLNDGFTIYGGPAVRTIRYLKIFNRWGGMVFEGYDLELGKESMGWDGIFNGKPMNAAVFAYLAELEFIDGEVFIFEGDVTLVR